ncbi:MAG TPA: hypothetical protein P5172_02320 [Syntrophales bacterium]|nr:hypothetical protein [Syntrophales bacterium]HRR46358.1 hypothetical protein [Syntrophales bacterium]HRU87774.1 hypothetical protein [Syntrophales bacterium]
MNRYLIGIAVSALLAILPATSAVYAGGATCNCAAQTCFSGGKTWPISACAECNGVCGSSSSAATRPADTEFLKGKYDLPIPGGTAPLNIGGILPPAKNEWEKKRQQAKLLESEADRLREAANAASKEFEDARRKTWKAEDNLKEAKKLLEAAKNLTTKDKGPLVYFAENKLAAAEAEFKKAQAEEQAAEKKKNEAWKKIDDSEAQAAKLLKEARDEERKAAEAARKEKLVAAAKEKLAKLKNPAEVEAAVKAAEAKAAEKRAAEAKAAKAAAEAEKKGDQWLEKMEEFAKRDMTNEEAAEAEFNKLGEEGNKISEDQYQAQDALYDAQLEREAADEEAAAMREAAKRLG